MQVSRVVLGCMSFGDPQRGTEWTIDLEAARPIVRQALEAGITTFDTANVYSRGTSEEITGALLGELARRDEVVIATKVLRPHGPRPQRRRPVARRHPRPGRREPAAPDTDYIDLYQIHRYDHETPIEETLDALHDLVRAGKARYIGASSMWAWQFAQAQYLADLHGWTRFVSMQDQYNLLMREEEREMLPFCVDQGIGVLPWSPLARGRLTRDWDARRPGAARPTSGAPRCTARPRTPTARSSRRSPRWPPSVASLALRSHSPGYCSNRR